MTASTLPSIHRGITAPGLKAGVFALEGLNALSTTYFFYLIYFYTQTRFNFGALQNLLLAAALGAAYAVAAFLGGKFAQRFGYFTAVKWGAGIMAVVFLAGSQFDGLAPTLAVILIGNAALCLTWPAMQGMMSEGESGARLQRLVGVYNFVWAGAGAVAYFTGGVLQQKWGAKSIFYVPSALLFLEVGFTIWLERAARRQPQPPPAPSAVVPAPPSGASPLSAAVFLKMAWLANPLAYLAINTVVSTLPTLAKHFDLTLMQAGFICSIWLFVRAAAFVLLWLWPRWHYRFRFLAGAYIAMVASFGSLQLTSNLAMFIASQIIFGLSIGLIYYSSLFYSMDVGETKGEHGGIHEAAIGAGNAGGPLVAALALAFFPGAPGSGAMAVCALLLIGLAGLYRMRFREAA